MVHPLDLLMLARTSKSLRAFFMHPFSLPIWKGALRRIKGLPDCTKLVSAPSLVHFIYEDSEWRCASCGRKIQGYYYDPIICWSLFARFCCWTCIATSLSGYHKYLPSLEIRGQKLYHKKTFYRWRYKYGRLGSHEARVEWLLALEKTNNELEQVVDLGETWMQQADLRKHDEIVERLKCLGWGEEIALMDARRKLRLINNVFLSKSQEFNERDWNKSRPGLIEFMEETRASRLEAGHLERRKLRQPLMNQVREAYVLSNPVNTLVPPVAELYYRFPPFRAVVEEIPSGVVVTLEHFREAMNKLPNLMPDWIAQMNQKLIDMMENSLRPDKKLEPSCLGQATTLFQCTAMSCPPSCDKIISYPRVLIHCGAISPIRHTCSLRSIPNDVIVLNKSVGQSLFNAQDNISFSPTLYKKSIEVVKLSGLPPTATADEIDKLDPIYKCVTCSSVHTWLCMTWRKAILHTHNVFLVSDDGKICEEARQKFDEYQTDNIWRTGNNLRCVHCRKSGDIADLKQHVSDEHGISEATQDDVVPDMDASLIPETVSIRVATGIWSARSKRAETNSQC